MIPEEFIFSSPGFLYQCQNIVPPKNIFAHIAGIDLVKGRDMISEIEDHLGMIRTLKNDYKRSVKIMDYIYDTFTYTKNVTTVTTTGAQASVEVINDKNVASAPLPAVENYIVKKQRLEPENLTGMKKDQCSHRNSWRRIRRTVCML